MIRTEVAATDGHRRGQNAALLITALAAGSFAIGTTEFATMSLLPFIAEGLKLDVPTTGRIVSAYAIGVVIGAPVIAIASASLPRRALLVGLMLLVALGNALSAIAPGFASMIAFRFASGLPHGAYIGVAALMAADALGPDRRAVAVGRVILGLTVATIVGVPMSNLLGQELGWRWSFAAVGTLAFLAAAMVFFFAPSTPPGASASPLRELGALRSRQVWLTLATGAVGFGGLFAVYAYLQSTLTHVTRMAPATTGIAFAILGVGMMAGSIVAPPFADRNLTRTAAAILLLSAISLALFPSAATSAPLVLIDVFAIGFSTALATILQTRLMDVAGDAQILAAALNPAAFNVANAIGPLAGGVAITAGWGWAATGYVGSVLALMGLVIWGVAIWDARG